MNMNQREEVKEVPGRRNFGAQHPVMTPQPCIMIATYDENQVPDVMMAAWGGQCDYDKHSQLRTPDHLLHILQRGVKETLFLVERAHLLHLVAILRLVRLLIP